MHLAWLLLTFLFCWIAMNFDWCYHQSLPYFFHPGPQLLAHFPPNAIFSRDELQLKTIIKRTYMVAQYASWSTFDLVAFISRVRALGLLQVGVDKGNSGRFGSNAPALLPFKKFSCEFFRNATKLEFFTFRSFHRDWWLVSHDTPNSQNEYLTVTYDTW